MRLFDRDRRSAPTPAGAALLPDTRARSRTPRHRGAPAPDPATSLPQA